MISRFLRRRLAVILPGLVDVAMRAGSDQKERKEIAEFVRQRVENLPDYLRLPMIGLTCCLEFSASVAALRPFRHLSRDKRAHRLEGWRTSRLAILRTVARFYYSLVALARADKKMSAVGPDASRIPSVSNPAKLRDIIVIGSGPGGAVTAATLAEAGRDVLLLEEGEGWAPDSCEPFSVAEMTQKYRNRGLTPALGKTAIAYAEGRCVGGGSEINSGLYHRTPDEVLERWRLEFDLEAASPNEMRSHFEACERDIGVSFIPGGHAPEASKRLHDGAQRLGWRSMEVPRWFKYDATDPATVASRGVRQSMSVTYIPRALTAGAELRPGMRALCLRDAGGRWRVKARDASGEPQEFVAQKVFIAGGAIHTPALLRRSGFRRHIGNTLQMHPTVKVVARFSEPVNQENMGVPVHQVKEFADRFSFGCSISSPTFLELGMLDQPADMPGVLDNWTHCAIYYAMIVPAARGSVIVLPGYDDPLVRFPLLRTDYETLGEALRRLCEVLLQAGAVAIYPSVTGVSPVKAPSDLARLPTALPPKRSSLMTIHLFSSCPMGERRDRCAVDSFGKLHGIDGLYVADGSLLCSAPGVNPQGSIMAFARRNALHFLAA